TGTVFVMNVCHSLAGEIPVPGFHPEGRYEFKIDLDGDAVEDLTYRLTFGDRDANGDQKLDLQVIAGGDASDPHAGGQSIGSGVTDQVVDAEHGIRVWTGHAGDPFWIEPDVLHAVGHAVQDGTQIDLSGWSPDRATNIFAGHTVYAIVVEVPDTELRAT